MEDSVLNRSLEETRELQARWSQFRDFYGMAGRSKQRLTAQAEMKFLELKSRIAMLHDGFMEKLQHEQKTGMNIMTIVGDCILLNRVQNASDAEKQKFEFDWNECYMLITEQVGALEEEKERLAAISEKVYKAGKRKEEIKAKIHNFLHSAGLKFTLIGIAIFMLVYGIPSFGIYDYREFGKISFTKPAYQFFVNKVYRKFLNKDLEFLESDEIPEVELAKMDLPKSITTVTDQPLDEKYFKEIELPSIMSKENLARAKELLAPKTSIQAERFQAESHDTRFYWILFEKTQTAKDFVSLLQQTVKGLKDNDRQNFVKISYVQRQANFVMIGRGEHVHHAAYPQSKFKLPEKSPNLLEQ